MATDEPVEISALNANISFITDTLAAPGTLQWFADRLVGKNFLPRRVAQGILGTLGVSPDRQAGQLIDSVFTKIRTSDRKREWFDSFVDIFSSEASYAELVRKLKRSIGNANGSGSAGKTLKRYIDLSFSAL